MHKYYFHVNTLFTSYVRDTMIQYLLIQKKNKAQLRDLGFVTFGLYHMPDFTGA